MDMAIFILFPDYPSILSISGFESHRPKGGIGVKRMSTMIRRLAVRLPVLPILLSFAGAEAAISAFALRTIRPAGNEHYRETLLAADIDKDGDVDFFSGQGRGNSSWWFERRPDGWNRRLVSDSNVADVGAVVLDVDADGWPDKVTAGFWYRNPGFPAGGLAADAPDRPFTPCRYTPQEFVHDILSADIDGDGRKDVLSIDYDGIRWFRAPPSDSACGEWQVGMINGSTNPVQQHGGIAAGDLDGDGDQDLARMDRWYENGDGKGGDWIEHANIPLEPVRQGGYGLSGRALIADLDRDGHPDLVETECDIGNGRIFWFSNSGGKGRKWEARMLKDSLDGQDFHSLILGDFDGDGDADLFSAGGGMSDSARKAYVWENLDGEGGSWKEHVVMEGPLQMHDAAGADLDGDGDLDVLGKDWSGGSHFYLENQAVPNPGAGVLRPTTPGRAPIRTAPAWKAAFPDGGRWRRADGRLLAPWR